MTGGRGVRGVLDHLEIVPFGERHDGVHVTGDTGIMHGDDGLGLRRDGSSQFGGIQVHGCGFDVNHDRGGTKEEKGIDGGNIGVAGQDDFVARSNVNENGRHFQGTGARWCQEDLAATAHQVFEPTLAFLCEFGASRYRPLRGSFDKFVLTSHEGRLIK